MTHIRQILAATSLTLLLAPLAQGSRCTVVPFRTDGGYNYVDTHGPIRGVLNDFDGDGHPDVAAATRWGISLAYNVPNFVSPDTSLNAPTATYTDIAAADFDHAHGLDLVAVSAEANLIVVAMNQGATFTLTTLTAASPKRVVTGDFNGDGNSDFLVASTTGAVSLFPGNGNGTFAAPLALFTLQATPTAFLLADVNGDGRLDLLTGYAGVSGIEVRTGKAGGSFNAPVAVGGGNSVFDIVLADVTGDGKADLLTANNDDGTFSLLRGHGNGTFDPAVTYTTAGLPGAIAVGDLTGDGKPEIVVMNTYGSFFIHRNLGDGTFTAKPAAPYVSTERLEAAYLFAVDFSGDGRIDLLTSDVATGYYAYNMCGSSVPRDAIDRRTVNPGQQVTIEYDVDAAGDVNTIAPTGNVTFKDGTTVLGTVPLTKSAPLFGSPTGRGVSFTTTFASTGTHTITMEYSGDDNFDPTTHTDTAIVTAVTTSITLDISPRETDYASGFHLTPVVTASDGSKVKDGGYSYTVDGAGNFGWSGLITTVEHIPAGTHQIVGRYNGYYTQPPSGPSAPVTVVVAKSTPQLSAKLQGTTGIEATLAIPARATGRIFVTENGGPRGSSDIDTSVYLSATVSIPIGTLPPGTHTLQVAYSGDDNVNGVRTNVVVTVPGTPPPPKRRSVKP